MNLNRIALVCLAAYALLVPAFGHSQEQAAPKVSAIGAQGKTGCGENPHRDNRLWITRAGVYENYLIDGEFQTRNLVKITTDDVTLRNCTVRNGDHNGIAVYGKNVLIENCKVHHMLKGTFRNQQDAHGITGQPDNLVIRNCEVYHVSGDSVQFDPDRKPWDNVLIENCTFVCAPLKSDVAGFRRGERPGENALDTKQLAKHPRSRITMRNCLCYGWKEGQINVMAAVNLKDHVDATIENCVFADNEISFRLRGDTGERGGARVLIRNCAIYHSQIGLRLEDRIANLRIYNLGFGPGVRRKFQSVSGGTGRGFQNVGEFRAPAIEQVLKEGVIPPRLTK